MEGLKPAGKYFETVGEIYPGVDNVLFYGGTSSTAVPLGVMGHVRGNKKDGK